jgi:hypothetical protein
LSLSFFLLSNNNMDPETTINLLDLFKSCSKAEYVSFVDNAMASLAEPLAISDQTAPIREKAKIEADEVSYPNILSSLYNAAVGDDSLPSYCRLRAKGTALMAFEKINHKIFGLCLPLSALDLNKVASELYSKHLNPEEPRESDRTASQVNHCPRDTRSDAPTATVLSSSSASKNPHMSTLILPCAGRSSRFPGLKPKWLLTMPNGKLMFADAISKLDLTLVDRIVVGVLKEHVDQHCGDAKALFQCLEPLAQQLTIVLIHAPTRDQVQTIECILAHANVQGPIFIKDCDSQFVCQVPTSNAVATVEITRDLQHLDSPAGKSYAHFDNGSLTNIVEKQVIGPHFCVGGYSFASAESFLADITTARRLQSRCASDCELAISDLLWFRTISDAKTSQLPVFAYEDWGTRAAWDRYCASFRILFVDIDGTLIKNSGAYFQPSWGMAAPLPNNVALLQDLRSRGRTQIILTTSRTEAFRAVTEKQLKHSGIVYDHIIFGLLHCKRILINDHAPTNPFPSALAISLKRDADDLSDFLTSN